MKEHISELEEKFGIVNWYIEFMESGGETKQMLSFYKNSKNKINELEVDFQKRIKEAQDNVHDL